MNTLAQLAKASETQTAMLASLKEDLLLGTDSDEDGEAVQSLNDYVDLNAALTDVLDLSDTHTSTTAVAKPASCPDSGSQDDILESLTQAFVQTKEKSPAIAEKIAGLIDIMVTEVSHQTQSKNDLLDKSQMTIREVAQVIGLMVSSFPAVQFGELYYRALERNKILALQESRGNYDAPMYLSNESRSEIAWWVNNVDSSFKPIFQGDPD
ncbi:unnamed protein product, partial [Porites lobata]